MKSHVFASLFLIGLLALVVWWNASIWNECRADGHSFIYCMRLVSK